MPNSVPLMAVEQIPCEPTLQSATLSQKKYIVNEWLNRPKEQESIGLKIYPNST